VSGIGDGLAGGETSTSNEEEQEQGDLIELHFSLTNASSTAALLSASSRAFVVLITAGVFIQEI